MPTIKNFDEDVLPIIIEFLTYVRHCSGCCGYSTEQNRDDKC